MQNRVIGQHQRKRKSLFLSIFSLLFLCGPCNTVNNYFAPPVTPDAVAQIMLTAPKTVVLHRSADGESQEVLGEQARTVHQGDGITVRPRGEGLLQFSDDLWVRIFQTTNLEYQTEVDPSATPAHRLRLKGGVIVGESLAEQRAAQRLIIETDWAIIRNSGTRFWVYYDPATAINWVVVREGSVELQAINSGQSVTIEAGYQSWLLAGADPVEPVPASRSELERLGLTFPSMGDLSLGAITEAEWLSQPMVVQLIDTPTTPSLSVPPTDTPPQSALESSTDTPTPPVVEPATAIPIVSPEPTVAADTTGPIFLSELMYDPIVLYDSSCAPTSYIPEFRIFLDDPAGISSIEFLYLYVNAGQPLSPRFTGHMKATGLPQEFVLQLDIGEETRQYLHGEAGQIQYTIIATDNAGNITPLQDGKPIEIPIPMPC